MDYIYVCSPLRGNIEENIKDACQYCRSVVIAGCIPIAPHIYFTQFLDDDVEGERQLGQECGKELLKQCKQLWVFGHTITEGMQAEIDYAKSLNIPVIIKSDFIVNELRHKLETVRQEIVQEFYNAIVDKYNLNNEPRDIGFGDKAFGYKSIDAIKFKEFLDELKGEINERT